MLGKSKHWIYRNWYYQPLSKLDIDLKVGGGISSNTWGDSYISSGLRFIDDSYTQPGQVKEWAIWKGNTFQRAKFYEIRRRKSL